MQTNGDCKEKNITQLTIRFLDAMLIGKYKYSIDSKNRICVPHKFRGEIGSKCIISRDVVYTCLNLYPLEQWENFSKKIEELPAIKMRDVRQFIYSNSDEAELDSQGRIVLNRELAGEVGLFCEKEAMIIGTNTHAQIWNISEWEKFNKKLNDEESRKIIIKDLLDMGF